MTDSPISIATSMLLLTYAIICLIAVIFTVFVFRDRHHQEKKK